jgi:hypothetical protein
MAAISLNLIRVGSDRFTPADERTINDAVAYLRGTYATVGLVLRRIEHYRIPIAQAAGMEIIDDDGEAVALTTVWTVFNHAVDVFLVKAYLGMVTGRAPMAGPCDKEALGMNGAVVELAGVYTGNVLAHEVGHYLGLGHVPTDRTNLMFDRVPNDGTLTSSQGVTMRSHCFVEP